MDKLISVIVPIYNVANYLPKCITSIINQTYKNLEIILVDDGSTDFSSTICDSFKEQDERVQVIHKLNGGLSSARNIGIDMANGDLISFVDADDYLETTFYEELKNNMDIYESDIAICDFSIIDGNKIKNHKYDQTDFSVSGDEKFKYLENKYESLAIYAWNKLYKREIFASIRYQEGKIFEDMFIICDLLDEAKKISYTIKPLYNYVIRENSIVHNYTIKHFDKVDAVNKKIAFFENKKLYNLMILERNRKVKILIYNLAKFKHYKIEDRKLWKKLYKELLDENNKLNWKDKNKIARMFKLFGKRYIDFKFLEYKAYCLKKKLFNKKSLS